MSGLMLVGGGIFMSGKEGLQNLLKEA